MKKKIIILLLLLVISIPFQYHTEIFVQAKNTNLNVVGEFCEITKTWGNQESKTVKLPFTIRQVVNGISVEERIIHSELSCVSITGEFYDMWEEKSIVSDEFSYTEIKEGNSENFEKLVFGESLRSDEIKSVRRRHLTTYVTTTDNEGPVIDDSRVNYEFSLGETIVLEDITNYILCQDMLSDLEGHVNKCDFERIENFNSINMNVAGAYPITIVYSDNYGNETKLDKQVEVVDKTRPIVALNNQLYFKINTNLSTIDFSQYLDITSNSRIIDITSNTEFIDSSVNGEYTLIVRLTNETNETFDYNLKVTIYTNDDDINFINQIYGLRNHSVYEIAEKTDIELFKQKLENELICIHNGKDKDGCYFEIDLSNVDTNKYGLQAFTIRLAGRNLDLNFEDRIITSVVNVHTEIKGSVIDEDGLKEQPVTGDYNILGTENLYLLELNDVVSGNDYLNNATCVHINYPEQYCSVLSVLDVEKIDTSKLGMYYIYYVVQNEFNHRISIRRQVRVADIKKPEVKLDQSSPHIVDGMINFSALNDDYNLFKDVLNITNSSGIKSISFYTEAYDVMGIYPITYVITNNDEYSFVYSFQVKVLESNIYELRNVLSEYTIEYGATLTQDYISEYFEDVLCFNADGYDFLGDCNIILPNVDDIDTHDLNSTYTKYISLNSIGGITNQTEITFVVKDTHKPIIPEYDQTFYMELNEELDVLLDFISTAQENAQSVSGIQSAYAFYKTKDGEDVTYEFMSANPGEYFIDLTVRNYSGFEFKYAIDVIIEDKEKPVINVMEELVKIIGTRLLNSEIRAHIQSQDYSDNFNSKEDLRIEFELVEGNYLYLVKIYDEAGNYAEELLTIHYFDITEPVIYLKQSYMELASTARDFDYTSLAEVYDNSNEEIRVEIEYTDIIEGVAGDYIVLITAYDTSGNYNSLVLDVKILNINGYLIGDENYVLDYGDTYIDQGIATDVPDVVHVINEYEENGGLGEHNVYYYIYHNNMPLLLNTRKITVVDNQTPVLLHLQSIYYMENDYDFNLLNEFSVVDNYSKVENRDLIVWIEGTYDASVSGVYDVVVHAKDSSNNSVSKNVRIIVLNS